VMSAPVQRAWWPGRVAYLRVGGRQQPLRGARRNAAVANPPGAVWPCGCEHGAGGWEAPRASNTCDTGHNEEGTQHSLADSLVALPHRQRSIRTSDCRNELQRVGMIGNDMQNATRAGFRRAQDSRAFILSARQRVQATRPPT
jgi:hypothetical protein